MPAPTDNRVKLPEQLELDRIITLPQAAELRGTSVDTLKRRCRDKIIQLSPRRLGMRLRDALLLDSHLIEKPPRP
jgi:hypothetical protein